LEAFGKDFTAQGTDDSDSDIVVAVLDDSGDVLFADSFGGPGPDTCNDVAIDAAGGLLVTGRYATSLDLGSGPLDEDPRTEEDGLMMYIARFELVSGP